MIYFSIVFENHTENNLPHNFKKCFEKYLDKFPNTYYYLNHFDKYIEKICKLNKITEFNITIKNCANMHYIVDLQSLVFEKCDIRKAKNSLFRHFTSIKKFKRFYNNSKMLKMIDDAF